MKGIGHLLLCLWLCHRSATCHSDQLRGYQRGSICCLLSGLSMQVLGDTISVWVPLSVLWFLLHFTVLHYWKIFFLILVISLQSMHSAFRMELCYVGDSCDYWWDCSFSTIPFSDLLGGMPNLFLINQLYGSQIITVSCFPVEAVMQCGSALTGHFLCGLKINFGLYILFFYSTNHLPFIAC